MKGEKGKNYDSNFNFSTQTYFYASPCFLELDGLYPFTWFS